jgi:hypothetical protein
MAGLKPGSHRGVARVGLARQATRRPCGGSGRSLSRVNIGPRRVGAVRRSGRGGAGTAPAARRPRPSGRRGSDRGRRPSRNVVHESRVHLTACFPSLIHDPLLGRAAPVVEGNHLPCWTPQVRHDETDAGVQLAGMPVAAAGRPSSSTRRRHLVEARRVTGRGVGTRAGLTQRGSRRRAHRLPVSVADSVQSPPDLSCISCPLDTVFLLTARRRRTTPRD